MKEEIAFIALPQGDKLIENEIYLPLPEIPTVIDHQEQRLTPILMLDREKRRSLQLRAKIHGVSCIALAGCTIDINAASQQSSVVFRAMCQIVVAMLDSMSTTTGRASFYNTKKEQEEALKRIHQLCFELAPDLYTALLHMPGATDFSRRQGILQLLSHPQRPDMAHISKHQETALMLTWIQNISVPRVLNMFLQGAKLRINNARMRRLIRTYILQSPRLELWAVRYRQKLNRCLLHLVGKKNHSILRSILAKEASSWTPKEKSMYHKHIGKYVATKLRHPEKILSFVLGNPGDPTLRLIGAYEKAKTDIQLGTSLPLETLEGIRSTYHPSIHHFEILQLTHQGLTHGQKIKLQKRAKAAAVEVQFDPTKYHPIQLYLYAFEQNMTPDIQTALQQKAKRLAAAMQLQLGHCAILLDASASMHGDSTQPLRPMAAALALRDVLVAAAAQNTVLLCGGQQHGLLVRPQGCSDLSEQMVQAFQAQPDVVFVISDGYENSPAGRLAETLTAIRRLGFHTPVYQCSPVMAAETGGIRELAPGLMPALPVGKPEALQLGMIRAMLLQEPAKGMQMLIQHILYPLLPAHQEEAC